jgi:hypothetical protein
MRQPVPRIDDYRVYWQEVVTPDYHDFLRQDDNLRGAFHCAISLFHMADWLYHGNSAIIDQKFTYHDRVGQTQPVRDEKTFANAIADLCSDFELIRGIANSAKHLELRASAAPPRHPGAPTHAANSYFSIASISLFFGRQYGRVMLQGPAGQDRPVADLANSVYQFWQRLCQANGWPLA